MSFPDTILLAHWQYYLEHALVSEKLRYDDYAQGSEEHLHMTLAVIETGVDFDKKCRDRLDRIPFNRSKKYRRLRTYMFSQAGERSRKTDTTIDCEVCEEVKIVREVLTNEQWKIEYRLAQGENYETIAKDISISSSTLKVKVSRWRKSLRDKVHSNSA